MPSWRGTRPLRTPRSWFVTSPSRRPVLRFFGCSVPSASSGGFGSQRSSTEHTVGLPSASLSRGRRHRRLWRRFDGTHRGFAFCEFVTGKEAQAAMAALARTHLYGRHLVLEWAAETEEEGGGGSTS